MAGRGRLAQVSHGEAPQWDHAGAIVSVLPTNDFLDLDFELVGAAPGYEYSHRPYLVRDADGRWRRHDHREGAAQRRRRTTGGTGADPHAPGSVAAQHLVRELGENFYPQVREGL